MRGLAANDQMRARLQQWRRDGFTVFPGVASSSLIDAYVADLGEILETRSLMTQVSHERLGNVPLKSLTAADLADRHLRLCDVHNNSVAGKKLALHADIVGFLALIFDDVPVAMQSLTFIYGSEQRLHQDFPYVVAEIPSHLAAAWIALEDVHPEAGPLFYFPGSHRLPKFDFGDGLVLTPDSPHREDAFEDFLRESVERAGLRQETICPRKGDVFIWHSSLIHGGSPTLDPSRTRKSLVVHYSTFSAYRRDRRDPSREVKAHKLNGGILYENPLAPMEEDVLRRGQTL